MGCMLVFQSCVLDFHEWSASRFAVMKTPSGPILYENLSWSQRMAMAKERKFPVIIYGS
jgi:hypothetical protein